MLKIVAALLLGLQWNLVLYLNLLADSALLPLVPRVDVEFDRILGDVLEDLHQAAENLRLELTDEAASQQAGATP